MRGSRGRVEVVVVSLVGQSVEPIDAFVKPVGTEVVHCPRIGLAVVYDGSQFVCPYTWTQMSGVGATIVELQGAAPQGGGPGLLLALICRCLFLRNGRRLLRTGLLVAPKRLFYSIVRFSLIEEYGQVSLCKQASLLSFSFCVFYL